MGQEGRNRSRLSSSFCAGTHDAPIRTACEVVAAARQHPNPRVRRESYDGDAYTARPQGREHWATES
jgi:hypothetical protein